jgi:peptidylprolyl isomerase
LPKSRKARNRRRASASARSKRQKTTSSWKPIVVIAIIAGLIGIAIIAGLIGLGVFAPIPGTDSPAPVPGEKVTTASGLEYIDDVIGTGVSPRQGQMVTVHYTGTLTDGTKFDSSVDKNQPYRFPIGRRQVIQGWDEGIMTMKVGGKRRLIVPPHLGYGSKGSGNSIPPDATLMFEVELLGVG